MKKTLKKLITFLISASMLISSAASVFAVADAPETYTDVIYENDGSSSAIIGNVCMSWADTGDAHHGKADVVQATDDLIYAGKNVTIETGRDYVLSFDFKTTANDHPFRVLLTDTNNKQFAHFSVDAYGNAVIANTGWSLWDLRGTYNGQYRVGFPYTANEWHTVDAVFHPNGEDTKIDWYFDGEFKVTADTTGDTVQHLQGESGILRTIYVASTKTGVDCGYNDTDIKMPSTWDESKVMYVDNMRVSYVDTYKSYYAKAEYANGEAVVTFNETPTGNLTTAVVKDVAGNVVSNGTVTQEGRKLYIPVDSTKLIEGKEYTVVLPASLSVTGKALANLPVFTAPSVNAAIDPAAIVPQVSQARIIKNFETGTLAGRDAPGGENSGYGTDAAVVDDATGSSMGKVLSLTSKTKGAFLRFARIWGDSWSAWDTTVSPVSQNYILTELDVYQDGTDKFRTCDIVAFATTRNIGIVGFCFFDAAGNFVYVKNGQGWCNQETVTASDAYAVVTPKNKEISGWHNIKMLYDKKAMKMHYYLDNEYVGKADVPSAVTAENSDVREIRFKVSGDFDVNNKATLVDNLKISYLDTVMPNGTVVASIADERTINPGSTPDITLPINSGIKEGRDYILNADIKISNPASNGVKIYVRNGNGELLLSSKLDMTDTLAFLKNGGAWLDNAATNHAGYFHAFDAFADETKAHNLTVYADTSAGTLSVYVDKQYITTVSRTATNGIVPNMITVGVTKDTQCQATVSNLKVIELPGPAALKARINTPNAAYNQYEANIPGNLSSVDVYYSDAIDVTEGNAPTATLTDEQGTNVTLGAPTFDADAKKLSYPVSTFLANGTYTLSIANAKTTSGTTVDDVQAAFGVNGDDRVTVEDFKYVTEGDGELLGTPGAGVPLYVNAEVTNYTPVAKSVVVVIAEYSGNRLSNVSYKELPIPSGETLTVNSTTNQVTMNYTEGCTYKAMIWSSFDTGVPYADAIDL